MKKIISINQKINRLKKKIIFVDGDKSLSIRFLLLSSLSSGKCIASNLLKSDDVKSTIECIKKLGIKVKLNKNFCEVIGKGLFGYEYKNNLILNAGNSGTAARLLCSVLTNKNSWVKITGDHSLKKRDMKRIILPLKKFGIKFKNKTGKLPLLIQAPKKFKSITYTENLGSAQCKTAIMFAALKAHGKTKLKCIPSRNHTEIIFKNVLKVPIKTKKTKKYDLIDIDGPQEFKPFNYKIPGDISSASFFIVLTLLSRKNFLTIKNVNINPSRTGIIKILNQMGARIKFVNKKKYKGEIISDIFVKSNRNLKAINLDPKLNSSAIDEFLLIFLVASTCRGTSIFRNLSELNKKESKRLNWGIKILKMMDINIKRIKNDGVKIQGKPNLELNKTLVIKNFLKDHRVFMVSVIAALTLGGNWKIHDPISFKTSFPTFLEKLNSLGCKI